MVTCHVSYNDDAEHMPSERTNHLGNFARTCKLFSDHARNAAKNHTFELPISPYGVAFEGYRDGALRDAGPSKLEEQDIWWDRGNGGLPFLPSKMPFTGESGSREALSQGTSHSASSRRCCLS
jgi:hypothetical protein